MTASYRRAPRAIAATLLVLALSAAAPASEEASEPAEVVLAEITVRARQQEVDLGEAPIAVSTLSGADLERAQVVKLDDFNGYLPSLTVSKNEGAGRVVAIRGVGWETAQNLSTQPGVLLYLDGVYVANPLAFGLDLDGVERLEVFRGPQGTEFGQGAAGGAINIVTRKPSFNGRLGDARLALGTFDLIEAEIGYNLPLGERAAARVAGRGLERDGFSRVRGGSLDGYGLDDASSRGAQLSLAWLSGSRFSALVNGYLQRSDHHGAAQKSLDDPNPRPRELTQDFPSIFGLDNTSLSATLEWELGAGLRLRSASGLQRLAKRQSADGDRLTEDLVAIDLTGFGPANFDLLLFWDNDSEVASQELSLARRGDRLDWVTGLYLLDHENSNFFLEAIGPAPAAQFADRLAAPSPETLPPFRTPLEFVEDRTLTRRETALFGQLTWRLGDRWALTLGGRQQRDRTTDETTQFWFLDSRRVVEDDAFTWKLGADVALSDGHLLYALVSTGSKNGGFNPGAGTGGALDVPLVFAPERVTALEIGSRNRLAGGRARLHSTLFAYDYRDFQFIQEDPVPFAAGTGNLPAVEIRGLETELSWRLGERLQLDGHLALLDGEIVDSIAVLDVVDFRASGFGRFTATGIADRAGLRVDLKGNTPPKLPRRSGRLALTHTLPLAGGSLLTSRFDYLYRGDFQYRVFNNPAVDTVPAYRTIGLFFGYEPARSPLAFTLLASNLLDEDGVNSRFTNPFGLHTTSDELIPPRQVVASVRYRF